MTPHDTQPTISDLRLERYRLGELDPAERQAITETLAEDEALRARLAALEQSDREIAGRYPAPEMADTLRRRAAADARAAQAATREKRPGPVWRAWLVPALTTAACACLVVAAALIWLRPPAVEDATIKGGEASLVVHRRTGQGSEELRRGAAARQGDEIRIGYLAAGHAYGAILSVDGRGVLTQHLPRTGDRAATLQPSGTVFLDFAYELDDAPRWEVFYLVTSDAPFDLEPARRAILRAAGAGPGAPSGLDLPRGLTQFSFPLSKDLR
jgi:anti-sigma-K factor RskA